MNKISVVMTTYDSGDGKRTSMACETIKSLKTNLTNCEINWIIADDGSPNEKHLGTITSLLETFTVTNAQRKGIGVSKNLALAKSFEYSPIVLLTEDDWVINKPFDVYPYLDLLHNHSEVGMVRLGYLGGTFKADYVAYGNESYWRLVRGSGVYIYSGQISLRHKRFYDAVGYHDEGISPGEEELEMCKRFNGTESAPEIVWPAKYGCTLNSLFINIGMDYSTNSVIPEG
jgi:glycosyltransferase involved in cell wall biosynthesis